MSVCVSACLRVHTLLTGAGVGHLTLQAVGLLLQTRDVISLSEEEVGSDCLASNQQTCKQGESYHLIGPCGGGGGSTGGHRCHSRSEV